MEQGAPRYVTALGESDTPGGWRRNKRAGGILIDVPRNTVLLRGLSMPSPRCAKRLFSATSPLVKRLQERICGIWVVNLFSGEIVAFLRFEAGVQEIFAVRVLWNCRFPELLEFSDPLVNTSYVVPDDVLTDVPAGLRAAPGAIPS